MGATKIKDAIDRALIALLQEDARRSATEIARRLRLARSTIHERIARLEREGVIVGYSAILAPSVEGNVERAFVYIDLQQKQATQVIDALIRFPEIVSCHSLNGANDLICLVEVPQLEDLDALLTEVSLLKGVERTSSQVVLATRFDRSTATLNRKAPLQCNAVVSG